MSQAKSAPRVALPVHTSQFLSYDYVYAVISRRVGGVSLGINLNPDKICNFDCPYCQIDRSVPPTRTDVDPARVVAEVADLAGRIRRGEIFSRSGPRAQAGAELRDVAFAGDGEPTTCRAFPEVVRGVVALRGGALPADCHITLITNASMLHRKSVQEALDFMCQHGGRIWAKLDAGTEAFFRRVNRTDVPYERILRNLLLTGQRHPITIQTMVHAFDEDGGAGPPEAEILALRDRLSELRAGGAHIEQVQVYTLARRPAEAGLAPLSAEALQAIAATLRAAGFQADVYT